MNRGVQGSLSFVGQPFLFLFWSAKSQTRSSHVLAWLSLRLITKDFFCRFRFVCLLGSVPNFPNYGMGLLENVDLEQMFLSLFYVICSNVGFERGVMFAVTDTD